MALNNKDIEVIHHQDKNEAGEIIHSTSIKVAIIVDDKEKEFVFLSDQFIPISEKMGDGGTIDRIYIMELWKLVRKEVKKEFPDKNQDEINTIVSSILYIIQGTQRRIVGKFQWKDGIYSQLRSRWNYFRD